MKEDKYKKEVLHGAIAVIFDNQNRILLSQRNDPGESYSHEKWHIPGGGIEFGEHPIDTIHREIQEELGITVELITKEPFVHSYTYKNENTHVILLVYPVKYKSGKIDVSKDPGTKDARWFYAEKIDPAVCLPQVIEIIEKSKKYLTKQI